MEGGGEGEASQRSVGRAITGRVKMGPIIQSTRTRSSIPSKFETILNTGERERDGFARRTHRFDDPENDLPGPGNYNTGPQSMVRDKKNLRTSKRGTAGFASSHKRFSDLARPLFVTPGPGVYEKELEASPNRQKRPTATFSAPTVRRPGTELIVAENRKKPGPGDYETEPPSTKPKGHSSVFASRTGRSRLSGASGLGPGDYHDALEAHNSLAAQAAPKEQKPLYIPGAAPGAGVPPRRALETEIKGSAVFRSGTTREGKKEQKDAPLDPKNLPPPPDSFWRQSQSASHEEPEDRDKSPGKRPSSMFAPTSLDRFGNNMIKYSHVPVGTPGPGQYQQPLSKDKDRKLLISSAWAMSSQARFEQPGAEKWKPPGPAYYSSEKSAKVSHHLNAKSKWV